MKCEGSLSRGDCNFSSRRGGGDADRAGQARPLFRGSAIDFIADRGRAGKPWPSMETACRRDGVFLNSVPLRNGPETTCRD